MLDIAGQNMNDDHTYGVYFTDKDEGFTSSVAGLFTEDKEEEFKQMLIDTDEVTLMHLNVDNEEFANMAQAMGIQEFPYVLVYFNGDRDHNIHGPADTEQAIQIIDELERIRPREVSLDVVQKEPVDLT